MTCLLEHTVKFVNFFSYHFLIEIVWDRFNNFLLKSDICMLFLNVIVCFIYLYSGLRIPKSIGGSASVAPLV